ncbi:DUF5665 domain-containing protein [Albidovulum sp.]
MDQTERLLQELERLNRELAVLNRHRFVRLQNSVPRLIFFRFVSGLALGLGTVLGGSILLSLIVLLLGSIDFIPVIGEWAARIAEEMNAAR